MRSLSFSRQIAIFPCSSLAPESAPNARRERDETPSFRFGSGPDRGREVLQEEPFLPESHRLASGQSEELAAENENWFTVQLYIAKTERTRIRLVNRSIPSRPKGGAESEVERSEASALERPIDTSR